MLHHQFIVAWLQSRCRTERGANLVEYALLLALIAVVCVSAVTMLGRATSKPFSNMGSGLSP